MKRHIFYQKAVGQKLNELDVRLLMTFALSIQATDLLTNREATLTPEEITTLDALFQRRLAGEPVSRIIGQRAFWTSDFTVTSNVLDPRPESEHLIEAILEFITPTHRILVDLGTGSGCLLISLLKVCPHLTGFGIDVSWPALQIARTNAHLLPRIHFVAASWLNAFKQEPFIDVIVANPPYIPTSQIPTLAREVREWDPVIALDGGYDGLQAYRMIIPTLPTYLKTGGRIYFECGQGQHTAIEELMHQAGLIDIQWRRDLAGIVRVVSAQCP